MNDDTVVLVEMALIEKGLRTLTHDWRNILNGINLRIVSAQVAENENERETELREAQQLITEATAKLTTLSQQIAAPDLSAIPYPSAYFIDDLRGFIECSIPTAADQIHWQCDKLNGKLEIDFMALSVAIAQLLENTLRHRSGADPTVISSLENDGHLTISWVEKKEHPLDTASWGSAPFLTQERGRLGLGVYSTRRIVEAHRGVLTFDFSQPQLTLLTSIRLPLLTA